MERDHGPSYRLIPDEETSQARIGSAAAAFFGEREDDCGPVGSLVRRRAPAGNARGHLLKVAVNKEPSALAQGCAGSPLARSR